MDREMVDAACSDTWISRTEFASGGEMHHLVCATSHGQRPLTMTRGKVILAGRLAK